MKLPRVVYTRVESRANPDYQILGRSPDCGARATDDALEGFFRSLLGQPDTLAGFRRSCFFAPLLEPKPGEMQPVWVAGVARPSDKPDRHGRRGILNYSAVVLTEDEASAIRYDPWALFDDDAITDNALPFVDEPEHRFEPWSVPDGFFEDAKAQPTGDTEIFVRHDRVLQKISEGHSVLVCPSRGQTLDDDPTRAIERVLRAIHRGLPPSARRSAPVLTRTFRPVTSAARFRLVGAGVDPPLGDKHWKTLATGWEPLAEAGAVRVDVRSRDAERSGRIAAQAPVSHAADPWQPAVPRRPARSRSRVLRAVGSYPVISGVIGLLLVGGVFAALIWPGITSPAPGAGGEARDAGHPSGTANGNGPIGAQSDANGLNTNSNESTDGNRNATGNGSGGPREASPVELESRWQRTGAWRGILTDPGVRRRYDEFVAWFWPTLDNVWGPRPAHEWPPRLLRLAAQVALVQWQLDGKQESDLRVELQLLVTVSQLRDYGPVELHAMMLHPENRVPLGTTLRFAYDRPPADSPTDEVREERMMGTIRPLPGMIFDIKGRVRVNRRHEHQIGETVEIGSIADLLERNATCRYPLMQGEAGTIVKLEILSLRLLAPTDRDSRFPTTFVPIGD